MAICAYIFPADHAKAGKRCGKQAGNNEYCSIETHNGSAQAVTVYENQVAAMDDQPSGAEDQGAHQLILIEEGERAVQLKHQQLEAHFKAQWEHAQQQINAEQERLTRGFHELQLKQEEQARAWASPGAGPAASSISDAAAVAAKKKTSIRDMLINNANNAFQSEDHALTVLNACNDKLQQTLDALVFANSSDATSDQPDQLLDDLLRRLRIGH